MKKLQKMTVACAALLLMTVTVFPVDLKNEDGRRYEVKIHDGPTTLNSSIDANSMQLSVCRDCVIEVVGVGTVKVKGSVTVVIKDGKLSKQ
ncbi:MAG: hypothetical protein H0U81_13565 [Pyrinomonadaceae bacterium]|nr:hypothetical protein [Pyrinomonadaceae bacterium]